LSAFNRRWETASTAGTLNLVHMGTWAALFGTMLVTGFANAPHPGDSVPFWKQAFAAGKPFAGHSLIIAAGSQAEVQHSGAAKNELGVIAMEGKIIPANQSTAAHYFVEACSLGNVNGCANAASQFLFRRERTSDIDVMRTFNQLERIHATTPSFETNYFLAAAHETGRGRTVDLNRAVALYERCGLDNPYACKGIARIVLSGKGPNYELRKIAPTLEAGATAGDDESCWYLAYMHDSGYGVERDPQKARGYMERACSLGAAKACEVLQQPKFPPFSKPQMVVPGWSTAFPMQ
jgi:TPR repeat protein